MSMREDETIGAFAETRLDPSSKAGSDASADAWVGRVLEGRYELVKKLGEGGMGAVYEGLHRRIGRRVAIKLLHPALASNPTQLARFEREARAATATGHPNVVQVTDMGELPDGSAFLVLEYLEGQDLSELLGEGALPLERAVHIVTQVCSALEAVHARGIVHRDLKPANVFLVEHLGDRDFAKVLDFGVAKFLHPDPEVPGVHTSTGQPIGTPYYMAPEQARGARGIDARVDVYALGVILFEALTGERPFGGRSVPEIFVKIMTEPAPRLRTLRPELSAAIDEVVKRALEKDPDTRFQSVSALADALGEALAAQNEDAVSTAAPTLPQSASATRAEPARAPTSRGRFAYLAAAALALAAAAGATWYRTRTPELSPASSADRSEIIAHDGPATPSRAPSDDAPSPAPTEPVVTVPTERTAAVPGTGPETAGDDQAARPARGRSQRRGVVLRVPPAPADPVAEPPPRPEPAPAGTAQPNDEPRPANDRTLLDL